MVDINKNKHMKIIIEGKDLDCVKKAVVIISNYIYKKHGIISDYNNELLTALLGENWNDEYDIGCRYIED